MSEPTRFIPSGDRADEVALDVERAIREGALSPGQRLPAIRDVADRSGLSPTTVAAAYRLLRERGLIDTHPRGSRVTHRPPLRLPAAAQLPPGTLDLADGNPDPELLPPLGAHLERVLELQPAVLYGASPDVEELIELGRTQFDVAGVPAEHVAVVGGALDGIERTLMARLHRGDRIAVEDPTFDAILDLLRALQLEPMPVAVDDEGPRPDALEEALGEGAAACLITPRVHNPTGAAVGAGRSKALRDVLARFPDVLVIEDDHAHGVAGVDHHPLCHDRRAWALIRSAGKALAPDLRAAVMVGDATTVTRVAGRRALGTGWVSNILQRLLVALWTDPQTPARLQAATETYRQRRQALLDELARVGIEAHGRSGWNVWVPVDDETAVVGHLHATGWAVRAGHRFRLRSGPAIRITTARLDPTRAGELATDLAAGLDTPQPIRGA